MATLTVPAEQEKEERIAAPSLPLVRYVPSVPSRAATSEGVWRFRKSLPELPEITLGEGSTPLLELAQIASEAGGGRLFAKLESANPTGSFKDRGSALVAAAARRANAPNLALASTGNAGASQAAYAARAGLRLTVAVPRSTDPGKLWQMRAHGAEIMMVDGDFSDCDAAYKALVDSGYFAAGTSNPYRQEGAKTLAYELFEQHGAGIDRVIAPCGTGGLIVALGKGFAEIAASVPGFKAPAIDVVQLGALMPLDGADPSRKAVATAATGINIANPSMRDNVVRIVRESGGMIHSVSEEELLAAQTALAKKEGVGAEPTASVTVAAYANARREMRIGASEIVVAIITGHILKAPVQV
ncbi:MAG: threonine synthase, partial [Usitatibacter sp.]